MSGFHPLHLVSSLQHFLLSLTWSLTVALARIEGNIAETTAIFIPASAKVDTAVKPALNEKPSWGNRTSSLVSVYLKTDEGLMV